MRDHHGSPAEHGCHFCGYPLPGPERVVEADGRRFCTAACRSAFEDGDEPFAGALGFKRRPVGVEALEAGLPGGLPGNAAVLVSGQEGTRLHGVLLEVVWRALRRGEPAVVVSIDESPTALVDSFLAHGWNVLPSLEAGDLGVVDLFTERLAHEEAIRSRENRWNEHVWSVLEDSLRVVRDPSDVREVANQTDNALDDREMTTTGVVAVDYLSELPTFAQEARAAALLKELRALVAQSRYVPILAGASRPRRTDLYTTDFPHNREYLFDGIVDLRLNDERRDGERVKELSVRKMDEAPTVDRWFAYEFRPDRGFVTCGPVDEVQEQPPQ